MIKRAFKIGHQKSSETFLPSIQSLAGEDGTYIIDMAGLKDLDGHLTEITNQFINKKLFNMVDNMVILIPFTMGSLNESRGGGMIQ